MRVAIGGASGLLGSRLAEALIERGDEVIRLVRGPVTNFGQRSWDPREGTISGAGLRDVDAVVNLAGAPIAGARWSQSYRQEILNSRVNTTQTVVNALGEASASGNARCKTFLSASAIGIYGADRGDEILTERSSLGDGFLADVCRQWEGAAAPAADLGVRVVYLRTANVLAREGGMLKILRPLYLLGLGGKTGDGLQWFSWISAKDHVRAMIALLDGTLAGPVNMAAPHPVRNRTFTRDFARSLSRPAFLPFPRRAAALVLTEAMVEETIAAGQRVDPAVLRESGFVWEDPDLAPMLEEMARRKRG